MEPNFTQVYAIPWFLIPNFYLVPFLYQKLINRYYPSLLPSEL